MEVAGISLRGDAVDLVKEKRISSLIKGWRGRGKGSMRLHYSGNRWITRSFPGQHAGRFVREETFMEKVEIGKRRWIVFARGNDSPGTNRQDPAGLCNCREAGGYCRRKKVVAADRKSCPAALLSKRASPREGSPILKKRMPPVTGYQPGVKKVWFISTGMNTDRGG